MLLAALPRMGLVKDFGSVSALFVNVLFANAGSVFVLKLSLPVSFNRSITDLQSTFLLVLAGHTILSSCPASIVL